MNIIDKQTPLIKYFNTSLGRLFHKETKFKLRQIIIFIICGASLSMLIGCQLNQPTEEELQAKATSESTIQSLPEQAGDSTKTTDTEPQTQIAENPVTEVTPTPEPMIALLPERSGPRIQTSGTVPHVQIGVEPVPAVNDELFRRAYALPGVEDRPTIVSLPGARGMWLSDDIPLAHPEAIVSGREFAHIHPDGSLHAPLPYERALEVDEKGWGERHPWADEREGWDGLVMLYTPQSMDELDITFQLIIESYNYVTGQNVQAANFY